MGQRGTPDTLLAGLAFHSRLDCCSCRHASLALYCLDSDTVFLFFYLPLQLHILGFTLPFGQCMVKDSSLRRDAEHPIHVAASMYRQAPLYEIKNQVFLE